MNLFGPNSILNWSRRVGRLFGIPIDLHISLLFFLIPILSQRGAGFWYSAELAVLVVLSILLHELGHALTAKRYGLGGLSITLHGFGGFATSTGYRSPTQDLVVTLAGPAVTFILGFLCLGLGKLGVAQTDLGSTANMQSYLVLYLGVLNIELGILNMLPMLPLDGGHAVQALLARKWSPFKAMRGAAHIGLVVGVLVLLYALWRGDNFVAMFGLIGLVTSLGTLLQSGGVRFGEFAADRRARQEVEAVKKREEARTAAYVEEVWAREKERDERERLRKLFERSGLDE